MNTSLRRAFTTVGIFVVVCSVAMFTVFVIFGQLRFQREAHYKAQFSTVSGLASGDFVRIGGVETGKVTNITLQSDMTALVEFSADDSVVLTEGTRAAIRYDNLIGGRYLALEEGAGGVKRLHSGDTIPLDDTEPALDLDALVGGFRPLFRALDPQQVNELTGQLIAAFQGQGPTIESFLADTAQLTNTLADRDQLVDQVIANLNTVFGSLREQNDQFAKAIDSLSELLKTLAGRKDEISTAVAYTNDAARTVADLLVQVRPPLQKTVHEGDRAAGLVMADRDYVDDLLATLPEAYQALARQGLYGDYFAFYICDVVLKMNGKGGQPVYVKVAGQTSGRCTPR